MIPTSQQFNDITKKTLSSSGLVVWMTGLSGAGKTTIARKVERSLSANSLSVYILDGDDLRTGLNSDLGYSVADRNENIRRISEVANILRTTGCIVLVSSISPIREQRALAKRELGLLILLRFTFIPRWRNVSDVTPKVCTKKHWQEKSLILLELILLMKLQNRLI